MHTTITHVGCNEVVPGSAKFGFILDLTAPATGWVLILLLVMYIGSQLGSSLLMMAPTADKNQRYMMLALPFVHETAPMPPSGLSCATYLTIGGQMSFFRSIRSM